MDSRSAATGDRGMPRCLRRLRIPQGLSHSQPILRGRSEQPLHRYHERPDVLRRARFAAPPRHARRAMRQIFQALCSCSRRFLFSPRRKRGATSATTAARSTSSSFPSRRAICATQSLGNKSRNSSNFAASSARRWKKRARKSSSATRSKPRSVLHCARALRHLDPARGDSRNSSS